MTIDLTAAGTELAGFEATVERGRLRFFAQAIGESDASYFDLDAARASGYPDLPVPPTFLFCLELDQPEPFRYMTDLGVDLRFALHAQQSFDYQRMVFAGQTLTFRPRIADIYVKKQGALQFVEKQTTVLDAAGAEVAQLRSVLVVRSAQVAQ